MTLPNAMRWLHDGRVMKRSADRGHAIRAHAAGAVIEAWGPSAAACYEEAAAALVAVFADIDQAPEGELESFDIGPDRPENLLRLLLEKILFDADARGHVTIVAEVEFRRGHLVGTFAAVPIEDLDITGTIPNGVSSSELGPTDSGWHCRATVDR